MVMKGNTRYAFLALGLLVVSLGPAHAGLIETLNQHQLAAQFGISQPMVSQILAQISWPEE
jgi:hypothetical protein